MYKTVNRSNLVIVGTHGAKMGSKIVPVVQQGDNLSTYQPNRNEPVPPDPRIISAVKHTPAVVPASKFNLPKEIEPRKRLPTSTKLVEPSNLQVDREDTGIPSFPFSYFKLEIKSESPEAPVDLNTICSGAQSLGPPIFVMPEVGNPPLNLVKISKGYDPLDCVITSVDKEMRYELDKLQRDMYSEFVQGRISSAQNVKVKDYLGLILKREQACIRVQVLHVFKESDDVIVYLIDHGWEWRVSKHDLMSLKPDWVALKQLSCHAELEGFAGDFLQNQTICVEVIKMYSKKKQFSGVPGSVFLKCLKLRIYNEHMAMLELEKMDDGF